ncbi:Ankyrin repeat domain-containing protein [Spatholobus suberectus]|nr:Ankyrin repeat domain-containing protein [Spatholobus suberectus]
MFHFSTVALNPQPHNFLFPLPISPSASTSTSRSFQLSQTLEFPRKWNFRSLSPSLHPTPQYDDAEEHVIGDCVVFEDGVFDDPVFHNHLNSDNLSVNKPKSKPRPRPGPGSRKKVEEIAGENLVPDKWRDVQAEINITKRERRQIAREMEFNSKVDKNRRGLIPLRDMNLEDYKAYKEAKLVQMKLLHNPSTFRAEEEVSESESELNGGEELPQPQPESNGGERVEPKNPRWAVYGRGLEDVTEFFNSDNYDPTAKAPQGRRKLFTKEEKVLLNKRVPDLAAATSDKWLPLHTLAACGEFHLLDSLLKHNVDINAVDKDGLTALHRVIIGKKQAITNYLLKNSANPFVQDKEGATLMHYAVLTASSQTIKILLLYNVDINLQDHYGWTPLHLAVQAQRTDLVRLLLIKGADKTLKNKDGLTPLDLCLYFGQSARTYELIKLFKQPQRRVRHVSA